jgi:hypothetical protein
LGKFFGPFSNNPGTRAKKINLWKLLWGVLVKRMKKLQYFVPQLRNIKKNSESRYVVNYLVECNSPEQHIVISCTDEDKNELEEIIQLENSIYYCFDCTDLMTLCNPDNKSLKKIKYKIFSVPNPDIPDDRNLETQGNLTLYDA